MIRLEADLSSETGFSINSDTYVILDLNGKSITSSYGAIEVDGNLTLRDSAGGGIVYGSSRGINVGNNGSFTMEGGTVSGSFYCVYGSFTYKGGILQPTGESALSEALSGASTNPGTPTYIRLGADFSGEIELEIISGTYVILDLNGKSIISSRTSAISVSENLTLKGSGTVSAYQYGINVLSGASFTMESGTVSGSDYCVYGSFTYKGGTLQPTGGSALQDALVLQSSNGNIRVQLGADISADYLEGSSLDLNGHFVVLDDIDYYNIATITGSGAVLTQPEDCSLPAGYTSGGFSVNTKAASGHTLTFQWYSNTTESNSGGTAISGATGSSYSVPTGKSGGTTEYYYCEISDGNVKFTTRAAKLTVEAPTTYTVTCKTAEYGSVAADKATAAEKETVTLTVTPTTGYVLDTLTADYTEGGQQKMITPTADANDTTDTKYTFTMPAANVTVTATFKQAGIIIVTNADALEEALGTASKDPDNPTVIRLEADLSGSFEIGSGTYVILDLNGKSIISSGTRAISVNGNLTLRDSAGGGAVSGENYGVSVISSASFTMEGGTVSGRQYCVSGRYTYKGGTLQPTGEGALFIALGEQSSNKNIQVQLGADIDMGFDVANGSSLDLNGHFLVIDEIDDSVTLTESGAMLTQPEDCSLTAGYTSGSFSVNTKAASGHTLTFQWYSNTTESNSGGTAISGATGSSYSVPTGKSGGTTEYYYCEISDGNVKFTTRAAKLTVEAPTIYTVTCKTAEHGSVAADKATAAEKDTVTLTVTPESGYVLDNLAAEYTEGEQQKTITPTADANDTTDKKYTFAMPAANVTVAAEFAKKTSLTVTVNGQTYEYDGQPHGEGDPAYEDPAEIAKKVTLGGEGLRAGDKLVSIVLDGATSEAGVHENYIKASSAVIKDKDGKGNNVTGSYDITYVAGTLTISPAAITITAASDSKTYDGTPLTNSTVTVTNGSLMTDDKLEAEAEGSATKVADTKEGNNPVADGYKIMHGEEDVTKNYDITTEAGTLTIEKAVPAYDLPSNLTAGYGQKLGDVSLKDYPGWAWDDGTVSVGDAGTHTFPATYTPPDTDNYETVKEDVAVTVIIPPAKGYYFIGVTNTWTQNSGKSVAFRVKRSELDELTMDLFLGLQVDGHNVPQGYYDKEAGSIIITLKAEYLEMLSVGWHTLRAVFTDGEASVNFQVLAANGTDKPRTGDENNPALWAGLSMLAGISAAACGLAAKKRKRSR